jgi:hypothetical protein
MSHLTFLAPSSTSKLGPALAHDIRNAMAVIALDVEMLEGLAPTFCEGRVAASALADFGPPPYPFDVLLSADIPPPDMKPDESM